MQVRLELIFVLLLVTSTWLCPSLRRMQIKCRTLLAASSKFMNLPMLPRPV